MQQEIMQTPNTVFLPKRLSLFGAIEYGLPARNGYLFG